MSPVEPTRAQARSRKRSESSDLADAIARCKRAFRASSGSTLERLSANRCSSCVRKFRRDGAFSAERWQRRWQAARARPGSVVPWQFRNKHGRRVHALVNLSVDPGDADRVVATFTTSRTSVTRAGSAPTRAPSAAGARPYQGDHHRQGPERTVPVRESGIRTRDAHARGPGRRPRGCRALASRVSLSLQFHTIPRFS